MLFLGGGFLVVQCLIVRTKAAVITGLIILVFLHVRKKIHSICQPSLFCANLTFGTVRAVSSRQLHTFLVTCSMHNTENRHQRRVKDDWWCSEWSAAFCKCSVSACLAHIFSFPLCIRFIIAWALKIAQYLPIVTLCDCYPTFYCSQWV